jgi:glycosyltransferase involved in cell wall biosynthesis
MRILVLNQYFHPDQSSTAQLLSELCEDLTQYHEVTVVCGRPSYSPVEGHARRGLVHRERIGNVRVLRTWSTSYSRHSIPGRLTNYGTYLASSFAGIMKAERPDIVFAMTDPPLVALAAMIASKVRRVPFVYANQDVFPEVAIALGVLNEGVATAALRWVNGRLRSSASAVVAIGRDMEQRLLELGTPATKLHVIPNWADTKAITPLDDISPMSERLGWSHRFVVMHSGNVGLSQDLESLVGAAEHLREDPKILIVIIGEGGAKADLRQRVADSSLENVVFLPYQPKSGLSESLGAADIHYIGLRRGLAGAIVPSKVYGIMAAGRPFIAAVERGTEPDLLARDYECGLWAAPGDPEGIAAAIRRAQTLDLTAMGARARRAARASFDRSIATEAYRLMLEEVARK